MNVMNLKRGLLLSVAALMVGSVTVIACTREHEDTAGDEAAQVGDECGDNQAEDEGPGAGAGQEPGMDADDAPATVPADYRGDQGAQGDEGPGGPDPGWGLGGPEGPRRAWGEERRRGGHGRGRPGRGHGRRGHRRGNRGGNGRGRWQQGGGPPGGRQGGGRRFGGMEREVRPWLRGLWQEIMALAEQARGRDEGPPQG